MSLFGMVTTKYSAPYTEHALASFFKNTPFSPDRDAFLLIDNDNCYVIDRPRFPHVQLLQNTTPKGFAENANLAVREALSRNQNLYFLNNDLIFSEHWLDPILLSPHAIISPLSNRELQYSSEALNLTVAMELSDYLGRESIFALIAKSHQQTQKGTLNVLAVPFFCVHLPLIALERVGLFDVSFGKGGAEDYDYCLRAHLAGISVQYALSSYVLHFGGKSSWSGAESRDEQLAREKLFFDRFEEKWGATLKGILLREEIVGNLTEQQQRSVQSGDYQAVIKQLAPGDIAAIKIAP